MICSRRLHQTTFSDAFFSWRFKHVKGVTLTRFLSGMPCCKRASTRAIVQVWANQWECSSYHMCVKPLLKRTATMYLVGLDSSILAWAFFYIPSMCAGDAKDLAWLRECAGTSEHSLVAYVMCAKFTLPVSNNNTCTITWHGCNVLYSNKSYLETIT